MEGNLTLRWWYWIWRQARRTSATTAAAARLVLHRGGAQGLDWPGVLPTPALPARGGGGGLEARRVSLQREKGKVLEGGRVLERKENGGRGREGGGEEQSRRGRRRKEVQKKKHQPARPVKRSESRNNIFL